ncbi:MULTISPECIES: hypothetical protein [Bacillus]|uniref:hypothetical protein n=1 Tax=Bacillus TaxID=1386 RepID=UPI001D01BB82|nr:MULTISPECIES: hypothetical protein [Bacillus]MCL7871047.1 hypothetical protein [Bacillus altitudinis]UDF15255.1 hypothetical protein LG951_12180 [Bacillus pumilus]
MLDLFTLKHAMRKSNKHDLTELAAQYRPDRRIAPNETRIELIEDLASRIPERDREEIIYNKFGIPKTRYVGYIGIIEERNFSEDQIRENIDDYNITRDYNNEIPEFEAQTKYQLELKRYEDEELSIYYRRIVKKPEYDFEEMRSKVITYPTHVRILIKRASGIVTVFTGDKDLANEALSALTIVFQKTIKPLDSNLSGITDADRGSFSVHTVKFLDYIYHGLSQVGRVGVINHIELETNKGDEIPQTVTVKGGNDLIDDRSVCEYLFIYGRELVGIKLNLFITLNDEEHKVSVQIGIRNGKTKVGIIKEKFTMQQIKYFYETIENNIFINIKEYGLIDLEGTKEILEKIRNRAPREILG